MDADQAGAMRATRLTSGRRTRLVPALQRATRLQPQSRRQRKRNRTNDTLLESPSAQMNARVLPGGASA